MCLKAIPREVEYSKGEMYGPINCEGLTHVNRVLYCVTPTPEVANMFRENNYDLLISHHPYTAGKDIPQLVFHTALDCCEGGLNDMFKDHIGLDDAAHFDDTLGWYGKLKKPMTFRELTNKVKELTGDIIGECYSDKEMIESVVICTGLGGMVNREAAKTKADCYILGENVRSARPMFKSSIEVGHTLSERIGVHFFRKLFGSAVDVDVAPLECDYFGNEVHTPISRGSWNNSNLKIVSQDDKVIEAELADPDGWDTDDEFKDGYIGDPEFTPSMNYDMWDMLEAEDKQYLLEQEYESEVQKNKPESGRS